MISIHEILTEHWDFWLKIGNVKDLCYSNIQRIVNGDLDNTDDRVSKMLLIVDQFERSIRTYIVKYQQWRYQDGYATKSTASYKCIAGHAHGYDPINRLFILECFLFGLLSISNKRHLIDGNDITPEEINEMMHKDRNIMLFTKRPIYKWSARMVMLQLRLISIRWNHLKGIATNPLFRSGIVKLLEKLEVRLYVIVSRSIANDDLFIISSAEEGGILSNDFKGKIYCTPQNNCGLDNISNTGSWITNLITTASRVISKIRNTIHTLDQLISVETCKPCSEVSVGIISQNWEIRVANFERFLVDNATVYLETKQLQSLVVQSICPSIVGLDVMARSSSSLGNSTAESDTNYWIKSRDVASSNVTNWLDYYVSEQDADYFLNSPLKEALYDIRESALIHTFQLCSKRNGGNPFNFCQKFFIRLDYIHNVRNLVFRDMAELSLPFIVKVGADYVVCVGGKSNTFLAANIAEALLFWSVIFEKGLNWMVKDISFKNIYKDIFRVASN